ncbi:cytochrome P450 [Ostreiculturibacter nitratireducens]|uniref:cytochrome P450 n=1 Tax=Ostreiculturibacter nitratireducens TaxID=3075226 RepID=UPI0031B6158C
MHSFTQPPTDPAFVQNPYPFYERARRSGSVFFWEDYGMPMALSTATVGAILRDRRFGREAPAEMRAPVPERLAPFYAVEANSMLELEPPRHTRLRSLVLRAFTSRRIATLAPEIAALSNELTDTFPDGDFDLLPAFAQKLPVIIVARLLGVPEEWAPDLVAWSNAMVTMYQARRTPETEDAAIAATRAFTDFLRGHVEERRARPGDDLITHLIAAEEDGEHLSTDELISTCILLLNAGHEASVHTIGNGVKALLENGLGAEALAPNRCEAAVEEILRYDPPLHLFTRWAYDDADIGGHSFRRGDKVGLLFAAANRDPQSWDMPDSFFPRRPVKASHSFGAGLHFCIGAPLARLELQTALPILFQRLPGLALAEPPTYANLYPFHGLERLVVRH